MGVITLKIDDALEASLRKRIGRVRGVARGVISETVEEALRAWLSSDSVLTSQEMPRKFVALRNDRKIAESDSLEILGRKLRELKTNPRDVIIESIPAESNTKMGLRIRNKAKG